MGVRKRGFHWAPLLRAIPSGGSPVRLPPPGKLILMCSRTTPRWGLVGSAEITIAVSCGLLLLPAMMLSAVTLLIRMFSACPGILVGARSRLVTLITMGNEVLLMVMLS